VAAAILFEMQLHAIIVRDIVTFYMQTQASRDLAHDELLSLSQLPPESAD